MGEIEAKVSSMLRKYDSVGVDTTGFIYHFEKNKNYLPFTAVLFSSIESGTIKGVTSIITLLEILVKPKKERNKHLIEKYKFLLQTFPNLEVVSLDEKIADAASSLRAEYDIKTPDAIQVASSILAGAKAFITNEPSLKRIIELDVIIMKEAIKGLEH